MPKINLFVPFCAPLNKEIQGEKSTMPIEDLSTIFDNI